MTLFLSYIDNIVFVFSDTECISERYLQEEFEGLWF